MPENKQRAFVLMPFEDELEWAYTDLIQPAFSAAGFDVIRADDIENQQNILRDIVVSISDFELVVAELTYSNPNVYYELGLAHALGRQVVLLTQDIAGVPFDLKSYRVFEYDNKHSSFSATKHRLTSLAQSIVNGKVQFGSPISDFGRQRLDPPTQHPSSDDDDESVDDRREFLILHLRFKMVFRRALTSSTKSLST